MHVCSSLYFYYKKVLFNYKINNRWGLDSILKDE